MTIFITGDDWKLRVHGLKLERLLLNWKQFDVLSFFEPERKNSNRGMNIGRGF